MALRIETFDNIRGGKTLYKALTHPHAAAPGRALVGALAAHPPTAIVDPLGAAEGFAEIFGLAGVELAGIYVQNIAQLGKEVLGWRALPVDELAGSGARSVLVAALDAERPGIHPHPASARRHTQFLGRLWLRRDRLLADAVRRQWRGHRGMVRARRKRDDRI